MKKFLSLILVIFVFLASALTSFAQGEFVTDNADLLSESEEVILSSKMSSIQSEYGIDIAIHTTMSTDGEDIHSYAENFYLSNGYGEDGLVFVINLNNNEVGNRDFYTYYQGSVYDSFGDDAYDSDYGVVNDEVLPYLADENYYQAFLTYLSVTEDFLSGKITYNEGNDGYYGDEYSDYYEDDYEYEVSSPNYFVSEVIVILVGVGVAFLIVSIMKGKMNTAVIKTEASDYVKAGSMNVTRRLDVFTHRHVTKTAKPKNNSSGGGARSSGGMSGGGGRSGGGGGKF